MGANESVPANREQYIKDTAPNLGAWLKDDLEFGDNEVYDIVRLFAHPEHGVTSKHALLALDEEDLENILEKLVPGKRALIKKAWREENGKKRKRSDSDEDDWTEAASKLARSAARAYSKIEKVIQDGKAAYEAQKRD